ncbi:DMT family transporter [Microaerobacter geothermalis]|uniref:DMT family transporter n=1 Tax=Microaerobacter geothermalis TaxID=674972 RepID=UPI001F1E63F6|nr:DMT family transporter [Microaerobacter geothermalis]MCF6092654.1 DMT family transporter [Microaerobacter geothermalis]
MNKRLTADIILLLVALIWGATFVVVQNAIDTLPPFSFNGVRFTIASLFLFLIMLIFYRQQLASISRPLIRAGIILGIWLFSGYGFQTVGLLYTTSAKAGFITGLSVVLVPVFAFFILKEVPKWPAITGVMVATVGLYLLTLGDSFILNLGDFLIFLCAISFGMQIVFTGKYAPYHPALALALVQIGTVAVLSFILAFFLEDWRLALQSNILFNRDVAFALLVTAIPATALAFLAQTTFQKFTTSARVSLIFAMEPVFAALTAYIWQDELLSFKGFIGAFLIFLGMILAEIPPGTFSFLKRTKELKS